MFFPMPRVPCFTPARCIVDHHARHHLLTSQHTYRRSLKSRVCKVLYDLIITKRDDTSARRSMSEHLSSLVHNLNSLRQSTEALLRENLHSVINRDAPESTQGRNRRSNIRKHNAETQASMGRTASGLSPQSKRVHWAAEIKHFSKSEKDVRMAKSDGRESSTHKSAPSPSSSPPSSPDALGSISWLLAPTRKTT
jgi:hypothetical protein